MAKRGLDKVDDFEDMSGVTRVSPKSPLAASWFSLCLASFQPVLCKLTFVVMSWGRMFFSLILRCC